MANQNAESQPGPSSRSEFIPWKLLPVDLERSSGKESNVHTVSPSQMPKPTPSVPCSIPRSLIEVELSDKSFTMIKSALSKIHQDMNKTSIATDASNEPISSSPIPEPTLSMNSSSSVQNAASNQSKGSSKHSQNVSKIGPDDEPKFIALLRKHSHLYDTKDPSYRDQKKKKESWIAVGKILDRTDDDCQTKWKSLREKYIREMKQISADENRVSKTKQFIKNMSFIPYKKRTRTKRRNSSENCGELPESSSRKRKKGDSASKSVLGPTSSTSLQRSKKISKTNSRSDVQPPVQDEIRTRNENAEADEAFVKTVELELQQYSPKLKTLLKAKIFQVFTEVRNRI